MSESPRRLAVIDIGSNAVRLHVALLHQAEDDCLTEVFTRVPLALGVDVFGEGDNRIGPPLEKIVDGMKRLIDSMQPLAWQAVATAALRQARNRQATLNRLRKNVGVSVRILSGEEEAALIGCSIGARHPGENRSQHRYWRRLHRLRLGARSAVVGNGQFRRRSHPLRRRRSGMRRNAFPAG